MNELEQIHITSCPTCNSLAQAIDGCFGVIYREVAYNLDAERLYWFLIENGAADIVGGVDLHEEAEIYASAFGREEPNKDDYIDAIRTAIDTAMKEEK